MFSDPSTLEVVLMVIIFGVPVTLLLLWLSDDL